MASSLATRPVGAAIPLIAAATAITLTVGTTGPPGPGVPDLLAPRISTQTVALTADPFDQVWIGATATATATATGTGPAQLVPAPNGPILPILPVAAPLAAGEGAQAFGQPSEIVQERINDYLANVTGIVPAAIAGGVLLGAIAGAGLGGQALAFGGDFVAYVGSLIGGYAGIVVGAALGVVAIPVLWAIQTVDLVTFLLTPPAAPASVPEPELSLASEEPTDPGAVAVAAAAHVDVSPGDIAVKPATDISTQRLAIADAPSTEPGVDEQVTRDTSAEVPEVPTPQPEPETPALVPAEKEPAAGPADPTPAEVQSVPKVRAWKHLKPSERASNSQTPSSTAPDAPKWRPSKRSERSAATPGGATQTEGGTTGARQAEKKAESNPSE